VLRSRAEAAVLCLTLLLASARAGAAGFASARFGGELGHPTTSNATALYYNPAALALGTGTAFYLDGVLALRSGSWQHDASPYERPDPAGAEGANTGRASFSNTFGGPMLGVTTRLGDLALGVGAFAPFGGRSSWDKNLAFAGDAQHPLAVDGVQRWHTIDGAITVIYFSAGAAYRIGRLSLGLSANLIRSSVEQTQAKNILGSGEPDTSREGRADLSVSGWHGSFGLGLLYEVIVDRLFVGLSYQAQPGLGEMQLSGTLTTRYEGGTTPFDVSFRQALPDVTRLGLRLRASDRLELRLHGDVTRWSVLQTQCISLRDRPCAIDPSGADVTPDATTVQTIRRRWRNTWAVRGGASVWPLPMLELFVGAGAEKRAPPASTLEPGLMDADNLQGALGARVALASGWALAASYTRVHYFPRDNTGRSELGSAEVPTRRADGGGRYELALSLVQMSLEKRFP
jgi:long-chain fatty acid transport protein